MEITWCSCYVHFYSLRTVFVQITKSNNDFANQSRLKYWHEHFSIYVYISMMDISRRKCCKILAVYSRQLKKWNRYLEPSIASTNPTWEYASRWPLPRVMYSILNPDRYKWQKSLTNRSAAWMLICAQTASLFRLAFLPLGNKKFLRASGKKKNKKNETHRSLSHTSHRG